MTSTNLRNYERPVSQAWQQGVLERDDHQCRCLRGQSRCEAKENLRVVLIVPVEDGGNPYAMSNAATVCPHCVPWVERPPLRLAPLR